eukprot:4339461-Amphidinium_carterae.1
MTRNTSRRTLETRPLVPPRPAQTHLASWEQVRQADCLVVRLPEGNSPTISDSLQQRHQPYELMPLQLRNLPNHPKPLESIVL